MALIDCAECGAKVSSEAKACPQCGHPTRPRVDTKGVWCPNCGNRDSVKDVSGCGCLLAGILVLTILGLLLIPFLPKTWKCNQCGHQWRA